MINKLHQLGTLYQWVLLTMISILSLQLQGCGNCKWSGNPISTPLVQILNECVLVNTISCKCSGGGLLGTCNNASQKFLYGSVAPNVFPPCPSTFSCNDSPNCS